MKLFLTGLNQRGAATNGATNGRADYIRQADAILGRNLSAEQTRGLFAELRAFYRDTALAGLTEVLRLAEETAALLSRERSEQREALLTMEGADRPPARVQMTGPTGDDGEPREKTA